MKKIQISIPQPCHEDWDKMSMQEKGRFCNSCQKTVVDFTNMSDRQVAEFFKKPSGSVCGRLNIDQLERDIAIPKKRIRWVKYFFQITIPAFLLSCKLQAQGKLVVKEQLKVEKNICDQEEMKGYKPGITNDTIPKKMDQQLRSNPVVQLPIFQGTVGMISVLKPTAIRGKVIDDHGNTLAGVSVVVKGTNTGTVTNEKGEFSLYALIPSILQVTTVGYATKEINAAKKETVIVMTKQDMELTGVVIVGFIQPKREANPIIQRVKDTIVRKKEVVKIELNIYPNPVTIHSTYRVELKKFDKGDYLLEFVNGVGAIIKSKTFVIATRKQTIEDMVPSTTAGIYFIRITNKKSGKIFTEQIIIN